MMIGRFKVDEEGGYTGELNALGLEIETMDFWPVKDKRADGADFIVIGYGEPPDIFEIDLNKYPPRHGQVIPNTNTYELGAAWKKVSKQGKPYLSVKLDGPTLAVPIHCALIQQNDGSYHLIWRRGEEEPEQAAA
jgi:uncharacterized protein (DUF736 family)